MGVRKPSTLEFVLMEQLKSDGLYHGCEREYRFHDTRKWQFDFAWPTYRLAVECEGGVYAGGRHTRGKGFEEDCTKYNTATTLGWRVYRFTATMINKGVAVKMIESVLQGVRV